MEPIPVESKIFKTIDDISAEEWNRINSAADIFHTHKFLQDIEKAKVENSDFWYLMFYHDKKLVATAVLSAFMINLDIFIQNAGIISAVRKIWPGFLKIKILMCGIPASLGQKNIVIADSIYERSVLRILSDNMKNIARKEKIKYLAYKEFKSNEIENYDHVIQHGYFRARSLPYTKFSVKWPDFNSYLNDLRHGYKRQILSSLRKIGLNGDFDLTKQTQQVNSNKPVLILTDSGICTAELFYESYMEVMSRASSKLETLNLDFFKNYFSSHGDKLIFIALADEFMVYGSAVLVPHDNELTFALIGKHKEKDDHDTYFNLITAIVKYAIENNFGTVNMGQTSYYPKLRVGAVTENEFIYFRSEKFVMHGLLKMLNKVIFPETKLPVVNVFKNQREHQ